MASIAQHTISPTVQAIYASFERNRNGGHRKHLGGSQIGVECERALWYQFHWCASPTFDGRMLRLFDHGDVEETRMVRDLRAIGATVHEIDPDTGRQWNFTAFGGHFGLSLDGIAKGVPESSKWHSLEFKTHNDRSFKQLAKKGVEEAKPVHYAQMQIGLHLSGIPRAMYLAVNKNTDELYSERLKPSQKQGEALLDKAERVIFSEEPLDRISTNPDSFACKWCDMHAICHGSAPSEVNCRTCAHSTAKRDGTWECEKFDEVIDKGMACAHHMYRPGLIDADPVDASDDWIEYQRPDGSRFRNGPNEITSDQINDNHTTNIPTRGD